MNTEKNLVFLVVGVGDLRWERAARRLGRQINSNFPLSKCILITNRELRSSFQDLAVYINGNFGEKSRGFGFWSWKPYLINHYLSTVIAEDEILCYIDAGCELNMNPTSMIQFNRYIETAKKEGIFVMSLSDKLISYCKLGLLDFFSISPNEAARINMTSATIFFVKKSEMGIEVTKRWSDLCISNPDLIDDNLSNYEYSEFVSHRHDQSVLSCIAYNMSVKHMENEIENFKGEESMEKFPILALRNPHPRSVQPGSFLGTLRKVRRSMRGKLK